MLNEMFQGNASKFAIIYPLSFRTSLLFPLWIPCFMNHEEKVIIWVLLWIKCSKFWRDEAFLWNISFNTNLLFLKSVISLMATPMCPKSNRTVIELPTVLQKRTTRKMASSSRLTSRKKYKFKPIFPTKHHFESTLNC